MADIKDRELFVAATWESKDGNKILKSRCVQWIIDGTPKSVVLERREFYRGPDGEIKMGKSKGFTAKDLEALKPHWARIMDILKNPPALDTTPPTDDPQEVPF